MSLGAERQPAAGPPRGSSAADLSLKVPSLWTSAGRPRQLARTPFLSHGSGLVSLGPAPAPPLPRSGCVSRDDPWLPCTPRPSRLGPELSASPPPGQAPCCLGLAPGVRPSRRPCFFSPPRPPGVPCSPCQHPRREHRLSVKQRPALSLAAPGHLSLRVQTWPGSRHLRSLSLPALWASVLAAFLSRPLRPPSRGLSGSHLRVLGSALALYHLCSGRADPVTGGLTQTRAGLCPSDGSSVLFSGAVARESWQMCWAAAAWQQQRE